MGGVSIFSGFLPVSLVVPIWGGIVIVVMLGVGIVVGLDYLDKRYKLSEKLINCIRTGFKERQRIEDYNLRNSTPFTNSILRGFY